MRTEKTAHNGQMPESLNKPGIILRLLKVETPVKIWRDKTPERSREGL